MKELGTTTKCSRCGKFVKRGVFNTMAHYNNNCLKPEVYKKHNGFSKEDLKVLADILTKQK